MDLAYKEDAQDNKVYVTKPRHDVVIFKFKHKAVVAREQHATIAKCKEIKQLTTQVSSATHFNC